MAAQMESVLVTGGAGYIGSHACKALAAAGFRPVTYDTMENGHARAVKWGPLVRGDVLDRRSLQQAIEHHAPVAVMHFAGYAYVGESVSAPGKYYRNNLVGTLSLVETMRSAGINAIVFSSSCSTYGLPRSPVIDEDHPQSPLSPYGASKMMVERILTDIAAAGDMRYATLRYFNAAGADPDGEIGEDHEPETHLIPRALRAALGKAEPLTVFGSDYPTPDGTCIRDYVHVRDLADAHVRALRHLLNRGSNLTLNLGTGEGVSVLELIAKVSEVTGRDVPHRFGPRRPGDAPRLVASSGRARDVLGWRSCHSDIETIIRTALAWESRGA
jgi:UDP-arabinose 4-epimerase